jgi:hypothetical protein
LAAAQRARHFVFIVGVALILVQMPVDAFPSQQGITSTDLQVPGEDGAWLLRITTRGGFSGQGRGSAVVTSLGEFSCPGRADPCGKQLTTEDQRFLAQLVPLFELESWATLPEAITVLCSDCFETYVRFERREKGTVSVFTLSWTDITRGRIPQNLIRFVEAALSLSKAGSSVPR